MSMQPELLTCPIRREVDLYVAMGRGLTLSTRIGLSQVDRTKVEIAILELGRNLLAHANGGVLNLSVIDDPKHGVGLLVESIDEGPGIPDIALALQDGYSTANTLGAGLPGVQRLMDTLTIESTIGVGTQVRAIKWRTIKRRGF